MKIKNWIALCLIVILSCQKKNTDLVVTPPSVDESSLGISTVTLTDLNEVDIKYIVNPPTNQTFSEIFLNWSTTTDFSQDKDSVGITITGSNPNLFNLKGLKQATRYYGRLSAKYNGKKIYSSTKEWITDTLKIIDIGLPNPSFALNKGDSFVYLRSNLPWILPNIVTDTKVFIGTYQCTVASDEGTRILFHIPPTIPSGKYMLELRRKGAVAFTPDSVEILRGRWSNLSPPVLPLNHAATTSGLFSFSTCQSAQKGYMIGGAFFNGLQSGPEGMHMGFILEYDPVSRQWTKKTPSSSRYFENPISYYYNNSIYVIGGIQQVYDAYTNFYNLMVKKMMRLDLATMSWSELDSMPVYGKYNLTSFELGNEWYIGMGSDSANRSVCCGNPLPSKKFWKFNPANNQWTQLNDFPGGHQVSPTCFSIGSKGYAFYGAIPIGDPIIATNFVQELWEYNPTSDSWTSIPIPATGGPPPGEKYQIIVHDGKAYFITAQKYSVGCCFYYFALQNVCLEWDPATNIYKKVATPQKGEIMKLVYSQSGQFIFQSDALGAFERIPNRTFLFDINQ